MDYLFNVTTNTTDLDTTKIHLNSVISTQGAQFMGLDLKDFYLGTIMKRYEYVKFKIDIIPEEIVTQYNFMSMWTTSDISTSKFAKACTDYRRRED